MENTTSKFSVFGIVGTLVKEYKTAFWGVIAPIVVGMLFWSLAAALTVVCLASAMFISNDKTAEAKQVWYNAGAVLLSMAFILVVVGGLAGIAPRP